MLRKRYFFMVSPIKENIFEISRGIARKCVAIKKFVLIIKIIENQANFEV